MEKYIQENLDSMLCIEEVDDLEIFVVDDGGSKTFRRTARQDGKCSLGTDTRN